MVEIAEASEHDVQVAEAEELLEKKDYRGAAQQAQKVLDQLEPHLPTIHQAALVQARAFMLDIMEDVESLPKEGFEKVWDMYELAQMLDAENKECDFELTKIANLLRKLPQPVPKHKQVASADFDVIIVGAGAAGIGTALTLTEVFNVNKSRVVTIERGAQVGESFRRWPEEMKFISPSFNQQGWTDSFDLNAITSGTSPAYSLHVEHPSGKEYAAYLEAIVEQVKLNVRTSTEVVSIRDIGVSKELPLFSVDIISKARKTMVDKIEVEYPETKETLTARYIVWAAGEFQYPKGARQSTLTASAEIGKEEEKKSDTNEEESNKQQQDFPGEELCMHNSQVRSWANMPGEDFIIIGGYESGVDATVNLSRAGKRCTILASTPSWNTKTVDPSAELAPYTAARLRDVLAPSFTPKPQLYAPLRVLRVEKAGNDIGGFQVTAEWIKADEEKETPNLRNLVNNDVTSKPQGEEGGILVLHTPNPPVLCTGFVGSVAAAASHLFEFGKDNSESNSNDESKEDENDGNDESKGDENDGNDESKEDENDDQVMVEEIESGDKMEEDESTTSSNKKGCLKGAPLLTEDDESTKVPGVFLVGPTVSHGKLSFCFVYKFRQRFAVVAKAICEGLGIDTRAAVSECRNGNMMLEDLGCCENTCGDVC